eukprot:15294885-Alexandrium_andersonii.AAC.1
MGGGGPVPPGRGPRGDPCVDFGCNSCFRTRAEAGMIIPHTPGPNLSEMQLFHIRNATFLERRGSGAPEAPLRGKRGGALSKRRAMTITMLCRCCH